MLKTRTVVLAGDELLWDFVSALVRSVWFRLATADGVEGTAKRPNAGVAGAGRHPSDAGLQPLRYAFFTVFLVWSSVTPTFNPQSNRSEAVHEQML